LSVENERTAVLPPERTTFRRRSRSESSDTRETRAQPDAIAGSVDSRTWLMAKCSRSSAPVRETHAASSSNAVPEIRPALITLASRLFPSWYTSPDEPAAARVYTGTLERAGRRC
jgi:hypothetical protein